MFAGTLPSPLNTLPPTAAPDNANVSGLPSMLFAGGGGTNALSYNLVQAGTHLSYGLGDGVGRRVRGGYARRRAGRSADHQAAAAGWICTSRAWKLPVTTLGTPGGTLTVVADDGE